MLKIKAKAVSLICVLLAVFLFASSGVFAQEVQETGTASEETGTAAEESGEKPRENLDFSELSSEDLYTIEKGDFTKFALGGACKINYLLTKDLMFTTPEAKFVSFEVTAGEYVERGQVIANFEIPTSESELKKREVAVYEEQVRCNEGVGRYDGQIEEAKKLVEDTEDAGDKELAQMRLERLQLQKSQYLNQEYRKIALLQTNLSSLKDEYAKTVLVAPFNGVVKQLAKLNPGDRVEGVIIASMYDPDSRLIYGDNSSRYFNYNQDVTITYGKGSTNSKTDAKVISANVLFADHPGVKLNSLIGMSPAAEALLLQLKDETLYEPISKAFTSTYSGNYLEISDVWLIPARMVEQENRMNTVETIQDGNYRKTYFYSGGSNNEYVWMLKGIDEDMQIIRR